MKPDQAARVKTTGFFLEPYYPYVFATLVAFAIADNIVLSIRPAMLPEGAPPSRPPVRVADNAPTRGGYNTIISRNIFSFEGTIPDALVAKGETAKPDENQIPVPSSLPLNLIGTIVHSNPDKSVATIEIKGKNQTLAFRPKNDIEGFATLVKIERNKVIFRNLNSNRLEYIETKLANKLSFKGSAPKVEAPKGDVIQSAPNQFQVKRSDLLKYTNNLASILQEARSVPNRNPTTGEVDGFRILDFKPGSIYEQLGLQRMDVIKGVNGEPVDSPAKAMELYNALKTSDKVMLSIERNGKTENFDYNVK